MRIKDLFSKTPITAETKADIIKGKLPIVPRYLERIVKDIKVWREAQYTAEVLDYPERVELMKIYKDLMDDSQIFSCIQIRTNKATNGKLWIYNEKNEIDKISSIFADSNGLPVAWFRRFLIEAELHKFYGNICLQIVKETDFVIKRMPTENLIPQWDGFIWDILSGFTKETNFTRYDDKQYSNILIPIGDKTSLGLLNKCAPYMIWKEVFGSWSMHADLFGQPLRAGKTDIRDKDRRQNMIDMLAGMTKATYVVLDTSDLVEFISTGSGDPYNIYKELILACDQAISKILLGSTGITDEKSFVGSAEIQMGILNDIILADKTDLAAIVNEQLIPRFQKLGYMPEGKFIARWDMDETLSISEWAAVIQQLSMAGFKMTREDVESKLGIELDEAEVIKPVVEPKQKELTEAISKMYNLYKDYE